MAFEVLLPVGKESHERLLGRGRPSAQLGKIDGMQCLHELPLACHLVFLAASVPLSWISNTSVTTFDPVCDEADDFLMQILKLLLLCLSVPPKAWFSLLEGRNTYF